jgi:DNA-binding transcriptional MerR regulator
VTYSTDDVVRATGLTFRQVDHMLRRRYVDVPDPTPGTGRPRHFTDDELDRVGIIKALVDAGLRPSRAAEIAQNPEYECGPVQIQFDPKAIHTQLREALQMTTTAGQR